MIPYNPIILYNPNVYRVLKAVNEGKNTLKAIERATKLPYLSVCYNLRFLINHDCVECTTGLYFGANSKFSITGVGKETLKMTKKYHFGFQ